jgi:hypothetical protein
MVSVTLSYEEGLAAAVKSAHQMMLGIRKGWIGRDHGGRSGRSMGERWAHALHGQLCEEAFCKAMNLFSRASIEGISEGDPGGVEIRGTAVPGGHLIIPEDSVRKYLNTPFVLVIGDWPDFRLIGWIYARDAQRQEWWRPHERPASYWVPQSSLNPIETLPVSKPLTAMETHGNGH